MNKTKYITPKTIEIKIESTVILAGSGSHTVENGGNKSYLDGSGGINGSWDGAKAPMRQSIDDWGEDE